MDFTVREKDGQKYIEFDMDQKCLQNEQDALDWVAVCIENSSRRLLVHECNLSPDFFALSTGLAGNILQKFINYYIKVAAVMDPVRTKQGRFREMVAEVNQGHHFRVFDNHIDAEAWLISQD